MPCFLGPPKEAKKSLPDSPSKTMNAAKLRLVPNLRLVFQDERQETGKGEHQHQLLKRQWINAIDTSLAKSETVMKDNRSRVANQRKPSGSKRWRPIQSPSEAVTTRKRQHSRLLEAETPDITNHKAIVPGRIYEPLHFVSPSDAPERPCHGKRRSTDRHSKTPSRSKASRRTITLSSSRSRPNHKSNGLQQEHKQAESSPLAFRPALSSGWQRDSPDIGHASADLGASERGKQASIETVDAARGDENRTSMMTSDFEQLHPQSANNSAICAIQRTDIDGMFGEVAIKAPVSQLGAHTNRSRTGNYSVVAQAANTPASAGFTGHVATFKGSMPKNHSTSLRPKLPLSFLHANSKSTIPRKVNATFKPSSAVLDHPEILLGLLEKNSEHREQDRYERQLPSFRVTYSHLLPH